MPTDHSPIFQLDDLVELYLPDALVQRPNVPSVRGTAAIREFFFGLLRPE